MNENENEDNVRVIRISLDRIGATLLLVVCGIYTVLAVGWLAAAGFIPALYYQVKYYKTYNDCVELSEMLDEIQQFMDVIKKANKSMGTLIERLRREADDGSDEK